MFPIRLKSRHIPWMTWLLIAVNVLVFFMELAPTFLYLGFWFLTQFFGGALSLASASAVSGIAWWAHIGGFVSGMLTFWLFQRPRHAIPAGFP